MAKRWIGLALIAGCLSLPTAVHAQCAQPCYEDPNAGLGPPTCGPLNPGMAPAGPDCDMGIPDHVRNAFDHYCGSRPDFCCDGMWFSAEYLYLFLKDPRFNSPLFTVDQTGAVAVDSTSLDYPGNSGGRLAAGFWLDADRTWSVETGGFLTEKRGTNLTLNGGGAVTFGVPGVATGFSDIVINSAARLWGAELNAVYAGSNFALISGVRYIDLTESLDFYQLAGATLGRDRFATRNQFVGGQLGLRWGGCLCSGLFVSAQATAAIGRVREASFTFGETTTAAGATTGNLFVGAANTGKVTDHEFCFVPEGQVRFWYEANRNLHFFVGGTYQYWLKALRPGEQVNLQAAPPFNQSDFWAFGASFGFEMRY